MHSGTETAPSWIGEGQKFALMGLSVKLEKPIGLQDLGGDVWAFDHENFKMPTNWHEWLGSLRVQEMEQSTFFLMSKMDSSALEVLDDENNALRNRVWRAYTGLLLSSRFGDAHKPTMVSGALVNGEISIRQQQDFGPSIRCDFRFFLDVTLAELKQAGILGANLDALYNAKIPGGHWRLFRILALYSKARTVQELVDRVHQYCRCIEGLIVPPLGKSTKLFKTRTELFIGPKHYKLMEDAYNMRGAVEHLHEDKYVYPFDRQKRLDILAKEAVTEHIARTVLQRIISNSNLWPHFANTAALENFWKLPDADRKKLWGLPFNPMDALEKYVPDQIQNSQLGM
jgi:hypothetical protein